MLMVSASLPLRSLSSNLSFGVYFLTFMRLRVCFFHGIVIEAWLAYFYLVRKHIRVEEIYEALISMLMKMTNSNETIHSIRNLNQQRFPFLNTTEKLLLHVIVSRTSTSKM